MSPMGSTGGSALFFDSFLFCSWEGHMSDSVSSASVSASSSSARKLRANRRNARLSTGPRTLEGRTRSARNSLRHGVFCKDLVLPGESRSVFALHRDGFVRSYRPRDHMELFFVE